MKLFFQIIFSASFSSALQFNIPTPDLDAQLISDGTADVADDAIADAMDVDQDDSDEVEEKFGEQNFGVFSEMRILGKIMDSISDFVEYVEILAKFGGKFDFRV